VIGDPTHLTGRYWPTRQQLIVVEAGEPDQVAQWMDAVREHQEASRDVIDLWDEQPMPPTGYWVRALGDAVERLRFTTTQVRQWQVGP
jgi:hypothetical protein